MKYYLTTSIQRSKVASKDASLQAGLCENANLQFSCARCPGPRAGFFTAISKPPCRPSAPLGVKLFPNSGGPALKFAGATEEAREEKPISPALKKQNDRSLNGPLGSGQCAGSFGDVHETEKPDPGLANSQAARADGFESRTVHSETYGFPSSLLLRGHNSHMRRGTIIPHLFSGGGSLFPFCLVPFKFHSLSRFKPNL